MDFARKMTAISACVFSHSGNSDDVIWELEYQLFCRLECGIVIQKSFDTFHNCFRHRSSIIDHRCEQIDFIHTGPRFHRSTFFECHFCIKSDLCRTHVELWERTKRRSLRAMSNDHMRWHDFYRYLVSTFRVHKWESLNWTCCTHCTTDKTESFMGYAHMENRVFAWPYSMLHIHFVFDDDVRWHARNVE